MSTWTLPTEKVWEVGVVQTAAGLNTYQRDNLNASLHIHVVKPRTDSVTSSTALINDQHLWWYVAASEVWYFQVYLRWSNINTTSADIRFHFGVPSGATWNTMVIYPTNTVDFDHDGTSACIIGGTLVEPESHLSVIRGTVRVGSVGGRFQFQWAQGFSDANPAKVWAGTTIMATRVTP